MIYDPGSDAPSRLFAPVVQPALQNALLIVRTLSHTMYQLNGLRKSTPPQKNQLMVFIGNYRQ